MCSVCCGKGTLLRDVCPLCDGVEDWPRSPKSGGADVVSRMQERAYPARSDKPSLAMIPPAVDLAQPLADILHDAAQVKALRDEIQILRAELEDLESANASFIADLADEREHRVKLEQALLRRSDRGNSQSSSYLFATLHACQFLDTDSICAVASASHELHAGCESSNVWKVCCLEHLSTDKLSCCSNFKAALTSHLATSHVLKLQRRMATLKAAALRIVRWTITAPQIEKSRSSGKPIWSPELQVGGLELNIKFFPGTKTRKNKLPCYLYLGLPFGTAVKARVFIGHHDSLHLQHTYEEEHTYEEDQMWGWPHACEAIELSGTQSVIIQIEFDELHKDGVHDFVYIMSRKND
eukprot:TRINITY_DN60868_c0_g1_i1.p1 TRINITY_DN60868_c0_g1~~TRINITY_DN60868_c0_g1_i1.p1  ORF type:complete len:353 (+),score=44.35 TRINITY_DN60868_c0_g1_i1:52-1110(+)